MAESPPEKPRRDVIGLLKIAGVLAAIGRFLLEVYRSSANNDSCRAMPRPPKPTRPGDGAALVGWAPRRSRGRRLPLYESVQSFPTGL